MYIETVDASTQLVSLTLIKKHLAVEHDDDDDLIASIVEAAHKHVEDITGVCLLTTDVLDRFDTETCLRYGSRLELALKPFIEYRGAVLSDNQRYSGLTLQPALPGVSVHSEGYLRTGYVTVDDAFNSQRSKYLFVGYKAGASVLAGDSGPSVLKQAVMMVAASMYDIRESEVTHRISSNPALARLLANYKSY